MKIYILRHEDRTIDATFFAPLTEKGLNNSINLINYLEKLGITKIYCSPYIRTMQTVYPFAKKYNMKINLEYGLIEMQHQDIIPPKSKNVMLPSYIAETFNYNKLYISKMIPENISYPETEESLIQRTQNFIKILLTTFIDTNENILIVTHQGLCSSILKISNKYGKLGLDLDTLINYPLGGLTLIFNNRSWMYKKIN
jgi:broad specificity phosphatase PhoE